MYKNFASDNNSGVHPLVMEELFKVNQGHSPAYGSDSLTKKVLGDIKDLLGAKAAYFTLNGTGTNICILDALSSKYGAVMCTDLSHIYVHETGAASKVSRNQLLIVPSTDGKLNPQLLERYEQNLGDWHFARPEIISIAQSTEMGTVYSLSEIKEIVSYAKKHGLKVHMDGARIANSAASLNCSLKELTADLGIDALSFGMCKNGLMFGECAVFFDHEHTDFPYYIKSNLQLQSKGRYVAAQFAAILKDELWLKNAKAANKQASYFAQSLQEVPAIQIKGSVDSNIIFAEVPKAIIPELQKHMLFNVEDELNNLSRFVCSFDTTEAEIDGFIAKAKELSQTL